MTRPRCVVAGAGRLAAGYVAPLLADSGWDVTLVTRSTVVADAVNRSGGVVVTVDGPIPTRREVTGVRAVTWDDPSLPRAVERADLLVTSVGPGSLVSVGRALGPLLLPRFRRRHAAPVAVVAFENHRTAPELLAAGLLDSAPSLASVIGRGLALSGGVSWRIVSHREVTEQGLELHTDGVDEAYVDAAALPRSIAPLDGSVVGLVGATPFDARVTEKLWTFNAGHAAAAYLGHLAGCERVDQALARPDLHALVHRVVVESQLAVSALWGDVPLRPTHQLMERFAAPALRDQVTRVAREPRRKLAPGDRLVGPALICRAAGEEPTALVSTIAAALAYRDPADPQSRVLGDELRLLGAAEVLSMTSQLGPDDELSRSVSRAYTDLDLAEVGS